MFKNPPQIYAHQSALKNGHFVIEDEIVFNNNGEYSLKSRECPHRGYIMQEPGDVVKNVVCKLHGFAWDSEGKPLSKEPYCEHFYKLHHHGDLELGISGLLFKNFKEDLTADWIQALSKETELEFVKTMRGESKGSRLWMMEQLTDVLHIRQNGIHPRQSLETPLDNEHMVQSLGENFAIQAYTNVNGIPGYWVFIYPGFGIEFEPGKLLITRLIPKNKKEEFGYIWEMQFYYAPWVDKNEREEWEKCIDVYTEDVLAVEKIKRPYFPLKKMVNKYEEQMHHWGQWYLNNKINDTKN
jgi:nitrite reductase/ring-hydroxylating ferredoxin subunit